MIYLVLGLVFMIYLVLGLVFMIYLVLGLVFMIYLGYRPTCRQHGIKDHYGWLER